jgi:hypothetical protein
MGAAICAPLGVHEVPAVTTGSCVTLLNRRSCQLDARPASQAPRQQRGEILAGEIRAIRIAERPALMI